MTKKEVLERIKDEKLTPVDTGASFHVYHEEYLIDDYQIYLLWAIDASSDTEPMVEMDNVMIE